MIDQIKKLSKKEVLNKATNDAESDIVDGLKNLLEEFIYNKSLIDYLSQYNKVIHEEALDEFYKYSEKKVLYQGRELCASETGVKYDFSQCGDLRINSLEAHLIEKTKELNTLKDRIKLLNGVETYIDNDTGEIIEIRKPIKTSKTSLKVIY